MTCPIGERVKNLREAQNKTQSDLAKEVGISTRTLRRVETLADYPLTLIKLNKILAPLGYKAVYELQTLYLETTNG